MEAAVGYIVPKTYKLLLSWSRRWKLLWEVSTTTGQAIKYKQAQKDQNDDVYIYIERLGTVTSFRHFRAAVSDDASI